MSVIWKVSKPLLGMTPQPREGTETPVPDALMGAVHVLIQGMTPQPREGTETNSGRELVAHMLEGYDPPTPRGDGNFTFTNDL